MGVNGAPAVPPAGYESLGSGVGIFADSSRTFLRVEGPRGVQMLAGLVSNDLASLTPPAAQYAFVLNPKGRPIADPRVILLDDQVVLDVASASVPALTEHLGRFLPPRFATLTEPEGLSRLSLLGPDAEGVLAGLIPDVKPAGLPPLGVAVTGAPAPVVVVRREAIEGPGFDLYGDFGQGSLGEDLHEAVLQAGGSAVSEEAYNIWRIERGIPLYGPDISLENLPQETGQEERAISLTKGCYTGQEVVARIHYRGHVNRVLRGLRCAEPLAAGMELHAGERRAGHVTSAVASPTFGHIALGYVRRQLEPGAALTGPSPVESPIQMVELPFAT
ncbi:MAG: glycine cleavage T C-terminal barrel domain-containing protein [Gemmatimonadota bacterium]